MTKLHRSYLSLSSNLLRLASRNALAVSQAIHFLIQRFILSSGLSLISSSTAKI